MAFTDFTNGLQNANDYITDNVGGSAQLTTGIPNIGNFVVSAEFDVNLKEAICSLLAGRGLKLPNLQICISLNLKELLGNLVGSIQTQLYEALEGLDQAFDKFQDHLKLDQVLGRINNVLGEITQIANMINFCSSPIDPIRIPNVLENAMESFLGAGRSIIDKIGTILPGEIGGCLINGLSSFDGGILGKINDRYDDFITGSLDQSFIDSIIADIDSVTNDINNLIQRESKIATSYAQGGSDLAETPRSTWDGIATLYNANDEGINGASKAAFNLKAIDQSLGAYPVTDGFRTYNSILELICDEDLLRVLRRPANPTPEIAEQQPVYNYCGEIIGYTKVVSQEDPATSVGLIPGDIDLPGYNAGGLPTSEENQSVDQDVAGDGTIINNVTNNYTLTGQAVTGTVLTTNNSYAEVLFDNIRRTPGTDKTWFAKLTAVGKRRTVNNPIIIILEGMVDNNAGSITFPGGQTRTEYNSVAANSNYDLVVGQISGEMVVQVRGDTGHTVDWRVNLEFVESP